MSAAVIGSFLVGAFFLVAAVLVFFGAVTVAGWGEGTIAQRVVVGLLALAVGGAAKPEPRTVTQGQVRAATQGRRHRMNRITQQRDIRGRA